MNTEDDSCNPCPLDTFNPYTGATACQSCFGGAKTFSTGATHYWDCGKEFQLTFKTKMDWCNRLPIY